MKLHNYIIKIPLIATANIHKCSAANPTTDAADFSTKLTILPIIPGSAINILSPSFSNRFAIFFNCCFNHPLRPGSGFGLGPGSGVGPGSGPGGFGSG